jgi:linoleoyl-CoA desaturase
MSHGPSSVCFARGPAIDLFSRRMRQEDEPRSGGSDAEPAPHEVPERTVSYEELKRHSGYSDAWIALHGTVYDITGFIERHPFGDTFRGNLGTECGGLFSASHVNTSVEKMLANEGWREKNKIEVVGRLDVSHPRPSGASPNPYLDRVVHRRADDDAFWQDLRREVGEFVKATGEPIHYSFRQGIALMAYYVVAYVVLSWLAWVHGSMAAAALLGFHMLCAVANVSHMATHFGFTRHRWLNFAAEQLFDLGGMAWLEWQIAHQAHHNQPHSSIDQQTNNYDSILGVRIHRYIARRPRHGYQHIYFWIIISQYLLFRVVVTTWWMFANRQFVRHWYEMAAHLAARAILIAQVAWAAHLHGYARALLLLLFYSMAYSYSAFILLYNDHEETHKVLDAEEDANRYHGKTSWAEVQVRTSNNWYPTNWLMTFIEFHYGYFNYHIEHHLFPTFKPTLMKKVSPIVRRVCRWHGVPYRLTTFLEVQRSLQRHIRTMGASPPVVRA